MQSRSQGPVPSAASFSFGEEALKGIKILKCEERDGKTFSELPAPLALLCYCSDSFL